ncbi:transmembrane protein 132E-like [Tubulanus polymorphus]|uniref:transmembrane protein 132E-like n=1 Tax=Tubulanus polymorphus TaxID=672921 RepID=UPI003DA2D29D
MIYVLWFLNFILIAVNEGWAENVDLTFNQKDDAYFIKPLTSQSNLNNPLLLEEHYGITQPSPFTTIHAKYGSYEAERPIFNRFFDTSRVNGSIPVAALKKFDISAHIVSHSLRRENPTLRVLCHGSHLYSVPHKDKSKTADGGELKWCLRVHAHWNIQHATSACILSNKHDMCIAAITIPDHWWTNNYKRLADVSYSFYPIGENSQCTRAGNYVIPGKTHDSEQYPNEIQLGKIELEADDMDYLELREDPHILIYVPKKPVSPGSRFHARVKLQAESSLKQFGIRIKTRHGINLVSIVPKDADRWDVYSNINNKMRGGFVTASVRSDKVYTKSSRIQEIFDAVFEVESFIFSGQDGRILWKGEYEPADHSLTRKRFRANVNLPISMTESYDIVPVFKVRNILNTAILSGSRQAWPLKVFAVRRSGHVDDITKFSTCDSANDGILKVSLNCYQIFVDGKETLGSSNATIYVRHAGLLRHLKIPVWVPVVPVNIEVSDSKLSQIKSWKSPLDATNEKSSDEEADELGCRLRYQQAIIKVYTQFTINENDKSMYWLHRKALVDITKHIKHRLRISDNRIARLRGNIVEGLTKGRAEIQALSSSNRVIGAKEIRVSSGDKVSIKRLDVKVISSVDIKISRLRDLPGTYKMMVVPQAKFRRKNQDGFLDIFIHFNDETIFPLHEVPREDYELSVESLNGHITSIHGLPLSHDRPQITAVGEGKGESLELGLKVNKRCEKKNVRLVLASNYVYISNDFSTDVYRKEYLLNDDYNINRPGDPWRYNPHIDGSVKGPHPGITVKQSPKTKSKSDRNDLHVDSIKKDDELSSDSENSAVQEARKQHIRRAGGLSPLEIGMYSLLGLVCVAVTVILTYCVVFILRYRRKRIPKDNANDPIAQAKDWVWIGRATLERNHVNTHCSQTLVPPSDFNGNQMDTSQQLPAQQPQSNRNSTCSSGSGASKNNVSTYKGSECSIRITTNPLPPEASNNNPPENPEKVEWDYEAMGMSYDQLMEYFDNLKESTA